MAPKANEYKFVWFRFCFGPFATWSRRQQVGPAAPVATTAAKWRNVPWSDMRDTRQSLGSQTAVWFADFALSLQPRLVSDELNFSGWIEIPKRDNDCLVVVTAYFDSASCSLTVYGQQLLCW